MSKEIRPDHLAKLKEMQGKFSSTFVGISRKTAALYFGCPCYLLGMDESIPIYDNGNPYTGAGWEQNVIDEYALSSMLGKDGNTAVSPVVPILKDPDKMSAEDRKAIFVWHWMLENGYDMGGKDTEGNEYPSLIKAGLAIEAEPLTTLHTSMDGVKDSYPGKEQKK